MNAKERIAIYCLCGASMTGWISPPGYSDALKTEWLTIHRGEDHGPATADQARNARRRKE